MVATVRGNDNDPGASQALETNEMPPTVYYPKPRIMKSETREHLLPLMLFALLFILTPACEKDEEDLFIGQSYQGGIIGYLLQKGDPGFERRTQHGLIIAPEDQTPASWGCDNIKIVTSMEIGAGRSNTNAILDACQEPGIAARVCDDLTLGGYDDWFLPSDAELVMICMNKSKIGGFSGTYWTSSESAGENRYAWNMEAFDNSCGGGTDSRWAVRKVRAVRSF